jgi:hypothetical protein
MGGLQIFHYLNTKPARLTKRARRADFRARCKNWRAQASGHPPDRERPRRHGPPDWDGRQRHHLGLSGPPARRDGREGHAAAADVSAWKKRRRLGLIGCRGLG